jgi:hypothetical protein
MRIPLTVIERSNNADICRTVALRRFDKTAAGRGCRIGKAASERQADRDQGSHSHFREG